jgi:hypothetical protein
MRRHREKPANATPAPAQAPQPPPTIHPNRRGRRHAAAGGARGSGWATPCPQTARLRHTRTCRHSAGRKRRPAQRHSCAPTAATTRGKISQPARRQARNRSREGAKAKHHAGTKTERHQQKGAGREKKFVCSFAEISVPPFSAFLRTVVCFALVVSEGGRHRSLSRCGSEQVDEVSLRDGRLGPYAAVAAARDLRTRNMAFVGPIIDFGGGRLAADAAVARFRA